MVKAAEKFQGICKELDKFLEAKMDSARERRHSREAFRQIQLGIDHCLMKSYEANSRGLEIFSKSWLPENSTPKALIFYCHGYGETCTFVFEGIARKLAASGYGVFAMDYPGFGLSEGLHGYIPSLDKLVTDVAEHFSIIKENPKFQGLPSYLFGQSLGGAVALKVHLKQPKAWSGAILVAPMCKFADNMIPPWIVVQILTGIAYLFPRLKIVPHKNFVKMAFRDLKKQELAAYNVIAYKDTARLWTALECLRTTQELEPRLQEVSLPLLILHGEADIVTDPSVSKALYEKASSSDKKLKLYKDAYHSLLEGEPDDIIFQVLHDIISWLDHRCKKGNL
ncbi:caffeoylshikimate esterase isoform X2 [Jatropha curcas]|uniref:caffeoylshikimate esterase isoform X2 n=1 Tax=Jatropha curcas TaxID=180498 RepID=UPI0009D76C14|nr:caffeoylshikimate esterase isoform X2 [Jatropha curcas]